MKKDLHKEFIGFVIFLILISTNAINAHSNDRFQSKKNARQKQRILKRKKKFELQHKFYSDSENELWNNENSEELIVEKWKCLFAEVSALFPGLELQIEIIKSLHQLDYYAPKNKLSDLEAFQSKFNQLEEMYDEHINLFDQLPDQWITLGWKVDDLLMDNQLFKLNGEEEQACGLYPDFFEADEEQYSNVAKEVIESKELW